MGRRTSVRCGGWGAVILAVAGWSGIASAHYAPAANERPAPMALLQSPHEVAHVQREALWPDQRPPLPAWRTHLFLDYDQPTPGVDASPKGGCDLAVFASASGTMLVEAVRNAEVSCLNGLYGIGGSQAGQTFGEAKMITIANALGSYAATYAGNNAGRILQLITFLRAGYYVQYYDSGSVGNYGPALVAAIRPALTAFVANSHFQDVNDDHGAVLGEFVILIDSSGENAQQLSAVKSILDRYGPTWTPYWYMNVAANNTFIALFRGHYNVDFQTLVQAGNTGITESLVDFVARNRLALVGSGQEYLLRNAGGELARFLQYGGAFHTTLHGQVNAVLGLFAMTGPGAGIHVRTADVALWYDPAHCAAFGLCDFREELEELVLPVANQRDCTPSVRLRSQSLTPAQADAVCAQVAGQADYFHDALDTGGVPVANDFNDRLEMVVFASSGDYETYSGVLFGNDTNNGGIYLEGNPADPNNQARFLAYRAEWLPQFEVWNLTHEYVHYLDGRFNMHGGFGDYPLNAPYSSVWYIEGLAEFLSYSYRGLVYQGAVNQAQNPAAWTLAQLFDNTYYSGSARVYNWGYLVNRFLFERHPDAIVPLLAAFRVGDYGVAYRNWLDGHRNAHNEEFHDWVECFGANNGNTSQCGQASDLIFGNGFEGAAPVPECTGSDVRELGNGCQRSGLAADGSGVVWLYLYLPANVPQLRFEMSGGTGEADLYVRAGAWPSSTEYDHADLADGNQATITIANATGGQYWYLMVKPRPSFSGVQVASFWP